MVVVVAPLLFSFLVCTGNHCAGTGLVIKNKQEQEQEQEQELTLRTQSLAKAETLNWTLFYQALLPSNITLFPKSP